MEIYLGNRLIKSLIVMANKFFLWCGVLHYWKRIELFCHKFNDLPWGGWGDWPISDLYRWFLGQPFKKIKNIFLHF
jgi:hypothetical protein